MRSRSISLTSKLTTIALAWKCGLFVKNIITFPCEDWFLQDRVPKYLGPDKISAVPWQYHKILNPKYDLGQQVQAAPEQIEKYGRVYRRIPGVDTIWQVEEIEHALVYYILYELV